MAYALMVSMLHVLSLQWGLRLRELHAARLEMQVTTARLDALTAQLQPHFLFNTLHTISELIHMEPDAAESMVVKLGELLRFSLETAVTHEVSLAREMEITAVYLNLQGMRYSDTLRVHFDVDADVANCHVPPLVLQPLVENALEHGLSGRPGLGTLRIRARRGVNGGLSITIADNGVGMPDEAREGLGISNVRRRLQELYGASHSMEIARSEGGGTEVRLRLPSRTPLVTAANETESGHVPLSADHVPERATRTEDRVAPAVEG